MNILRYQYTPKVNHFSEKLYCDLSSKKHFYENNFQFLAREKYWQKFRKFQILAVVALVQHVGTKTLLFEIYVTGVQLFADFSGSTLHVLDSPLYGNFRPRIIRRAVLPGLRLCCCLCHLRSKT